MHRVERLNRTTVHDVVRRLPDVAAVRARCQAMAMLDAILTSGTWAPFHSFEVGWRVARWSASPPRVTFVAAPGTPASGGSETIVALIGSPKRSWSATSAREPARV
jgi:hypothetical protein